LPTRRITRHLGRIPSHILGVLQSTLAAHLKQTK
jgi:hypothetical protein